MIKNKIHYQITGDISSDYGSIVTNPIIKVEQHQVIVDTFGFDLSNVVLIEEEA